MNIVHDQALQNGPRYLKIFLTKVARGASTKWACGPIDNKAPKYM